MSEMPSAKKDGAEKEKTGLRARKKGKRCFLMNNAKEANYSEFSKKGPRRRGKETQPQLKINLGRRRKSRNWTSRGRGFTSLQHRSVGVAQAHPKKKGGSTNKGAGKEICGVMPGCRQPREKIRRIAEGKRITIVQTCSPNRKSPLPDGRLFLPTTKKKYGGKSNSQEGKNSIEKISAP